MQQSSGPGRIEALPARWRRRLAEFEEWLVPEAEQDPGTLGPHEYCSIEFHFGRWPQPWPVAVRQAMLRRLTEVADRWQAALQRLDGPTYLGLWIFEPAFLETQLVAARGRPAKDYRERHQGLEPVGAPALYAPALDGLAHWEWVRHRDTWDWDLADVDPADRAFLLRMPQQRATGRPGGFTVSRTVWRGQVPLPVR